MSLNTAALLVYNCYLLHICAAKLARLNQTLTAAYRLVVVARIMAINTPLFVGLRADRALHRSGGLEHSIHRFYLTIPLSDVGSLGLIDFAKCLSRRVRGHDGRAHANLRAFANVLDSLYATPQSRTSADDLTKCARQMARIEKPAGAGNLRESFVGS